MFWKIYFWFIVVILFLGNITDLDSFGGIWDFVDLIVSIGGLMGLFLYAYKKRLFNAVFWKIYLPVCVIWDLCFNIVIYPSTSGQPFEPIEFIGFFFLIPVYISIYLYAFKFLREDGEFTFQ